LQRPVEITGRYFFYLADLIVFAQDFHGLPRANSSRNIGTVLIAGSLCRDVDIF